jgi:hypothetical protein
MSFQDPPPQRPSRYPAFAPPEDGYPSYQQRPPWDEPMQDTRVQPTGRRSGAQPLLREASGQQAVRGSGAQRPLWDTGGQRSVWDTGAQRSVRGTGAQRSVWDTGAQRSVRDTGAQLVMPDSAARQTAERDLPRRASGGLHAATRDPQARRYRPGSAAPRRGRGLLPGAIAGFLAAAVALGTANLVAAFVRPQASPIIAVGEAFIDRTPPALKNFAVEKFGENDKNVLLLGMYVTIALIAIVIGMLAWRRVAIGVTGIGLFGLFGAFVAITRPESHATDVIPSIVGGIAGITAIVLLVRAGAPAGMSAAVRRRRARARWAGGDA